MPFKTNQGAEVLFTRLIALYGRVTREGILMAKNKGADSMDRYTLENIAWVLVWAAIIGFYGFMMYVMAHFVVKFW